MKHAWIAALVVVMGWASPVQDAPVLISPDDVKWGEAPPALPPGAKLAVISGDPSKEGPYTLRGKMPANYKIAPHSHPAREDVTVLSGTLFVSMGDSFDASKAKGMATGSFMSFPGKSPHFVFTKEETVIQVSGMGPFELTYVNPADDPRNSKK